MVFCIINDMIFFNVIFGGRHMRKVVLAGACRTAIGTMGGALSTTPAPAR